MRASYPVIMGRRAWIGRDLPSKDALAVRLPPPAVDRLIRVAEALARIGRPLGACRRLDFLAPELIAALQAPFDEVRNGRGFAILRGLPVAETPISAT